jgi:hypothetical protein
LRPQKINFIHLPYADIVLARETGGGIKPRASARGKIDHQASKLSKTATAVNLQSAVAGLHGLAVTFARCPALTHEFFMLSPAIAG